MESSHLLKWLDHFSVPNSLQLLFYALETDISTPSEEGEMATSVVIIFNLAFESNFIIYYHGLRCTYVRYYLLVTTV